MLINLQVSTAGAFHSVELLAACPWDGEMDIQI